MPVLVAVLVVVAGPIAALPPPDTDTVLVMFRPGVTAADAFAAITAVDGRLVWTDRSGQLWALELGPDTDAGQLYRHGALLVSNGLLPVGCFTWSDV